MAFHALGEIMNWIYDATSKALNVKLTGSNVAVDISGDVIGNAYDYRGLSTSTKPTTGVITYSTDTEMDTADIYYYNGTSWVVMV
jgi:hypothetical protein